MRSYPNLRLYSILVVGQALVCTFPTLNAQATATAEAGGVLNKFVISQFPGSGRSSIQAIATDIDGNIYVAGTTSSPDLPLTNATQPQLGESRIMRSLDGGVTWVKIANPPFDVQTVVADPSSPQVLFAVGGSGIYKPSMVARLGGPPMKGRRLPRAASSSILGIPCASRPVFQPGT